MTGKDERFKDLDQFENARKGQLALAVFADDVKPCKIDHQINGYAEIIECLVTGDKITNRPLNVPKLAKTYATWSHLVVVPDGKVKSRKALADDWAEMGDGCSFDAYKNAAIAHVVS